MSPLFDFLWPGFALGAGFGALAGSIVFRRKLAGKRRLAWLAGGVAAAIACSLLWSGPMGAGQHFIDRLESDSRLTLDNYEMTAVEARLARSPLSRELVLSGPADDFQRSELVRIMATLPGVSKASWSSPRGALPLIAEGGLAALAGFLLGMFLAYLVELHRRYNAQWDW